MRDANQKGSATRTASQRMIGAVIAQPTARSPASAVASASGVTWNATASAAATMADVRHSPRQPRGCGMANRAAAVPLTARTPSRSSSHGADTSSAIDATPVRIARRINAGGAPRPAIRGRVAPARSAARARQDRGGVVASPAAHEAPGDRSTSFTLHCLFLVRETAVPGLVSPWSTGGSAEGFLRGEGRRILSCRCVPPVCYGMACKPRGRGTNRDDARKEPRRGHDAFRESVRCRNRRPGPAGVGRPCDERRMDAAAKPQKNVPMVKRLRRHAP